MNRSKKRILITGGVGFLGSNLCEYFMKSGCHVICLDNLTCGRIENIEKLMNMEKFNFINHDVIEPYDVLVDEIYNLACPASPKYYKKNPIYTTKTAVIGAMNALELGVRCNSKVFQASTSEIYGDEERQPLNEKSWGHVNPMGPRACYSEAKRCAESLFCDYRRVYSLCVSVARIFNTYGPKMRLDDGRVISNFIVQALRNEPITVYGDGLQTRSFTYVDDMVEGIAKLQSNSDSFIEPMNLGSTHELTIIELAEVIISLTNSNSTILHQPALMDDPRRRIPDVGVAEKMIGWSARTDLHSGIEATIGYFEEQLSNGKLPL